MTADPFIVHVARLRKVTGTRWHEERRGLLDPDHLLAARGPAESTFPDGAEAACDLQVESFDGGVMVAGTLNVPWQGVCARCAEPVGGELEVKVRERFTEPGGRYGDPADEEAYPIVAEELDLRPMIRDALLLELPLAPLCQANCRGLCPSCGIDRNTARCDCVVPIDPRWANLDVLRSAP